MQQRIVFGLLMVSLGFGACQKNNSTVPDAAKIAITFAAPLPSTTYHMGDTVHIAATITYAGQMHGFELKLQDSATGNILMDEVKHAHSNKLDVQATWVPVGNVEQVLQLSLIATVDHQGISAEKSVTFHYHP